MVQQVDYRGWQITVSSSNYGLKHLINYYVAGAKQINAPIVTADQLIPPVLAMTPDVALAEAKRRIDAKVGLEPQQIEIAPEPQPAPAPMPKPKRERKPKPEPSIPAYNSPVRAKLAADLAAKQAAEASEPEPDPEIEDVFTWPVTEAPTIELPAYDKYLIIAYSAHMLGSKAGPMGNTINPPFDYKGAKYTVSALVYGGPNGQVQSCTAWELVKANEYAGPGPDPNALGYEGRHVRYIGTEYVLTRPITFNMPVSISAPGAAQPEGGQ